MKTKSLRLPVLFASAGALIWTVSVVRAADSLEVRQDSSTSQKEVINEPSGAERTYSSTRIETGPAYQSSYYDSRSYQSGAALDPDSENDRIMHMYQRGRAAAESLDRQIKPNPIVVLPGTTTFEKNYTSYQYPPSHLGEMQQSYSSTTTFNEPSAAERETTSSTTRRYTTSSEGISGAPAATAAATTTESTAMLSTGTTIKSSDLIGMNIKNTQGETVGEVKDVVLDLKSGRVAYAVVSAGGFAGIGDKWLAVPPAVFTRSGTEKTLTWDIDKTKLSSAPTIDKHNWNAAYQQDYIGRVYSFYGVENPTANEPAGTEKKDDTYHHDSEQQNKQDNQKQDQDQSRNDASSSSSATQSSQQSELQKSQPEKSASASADVSKEAAGAQPSSSEQPSSAAQSSSSSSESKSSTDISSPSQSSSSSSEATKSEPQSAVSEAAGATTAGSLPEKAQMALKNDASLSGSAQDVKLEMKDDKLCVKGTVKSEDEKNRILEKVRATAGSTEIDDQLKVSSSSSEPDKSDNDK